MKKISSCVYGPVNSWRMGKSLGIDLLKVDSICSFACVYCQLGKINRLTDERKLFVPTAEVISELKKSNWREADVITFSGSGEPTLAANLGEAICAAKNLTAKRKPETNGVGICRFSKKAKENSKERKKLRSSVQVPPVSVALTISL